MNIIISIYNVWANMIFDKEKPFEFRNSLPNNIGVGDTIYIYETAKFNGARAIVGKCKIKEIINILNEEGKWPVYGAYPFIDFFCENIKKDYVAAETYRRVKKEFANKLKNYKYGYIIDFAFSPTELDYIKEYDEPINVLGTPFEKINQILKEKEKSEKYIKECDDWLMKIGFYNNMYESHYKFAFLLTDVERFDKPIPISHFVDKNNKPISRAPQSWMYTNGYKEE